MGRKEGGKGTSSLTEERDALTEYSEHEERGRAYPERQRPLSTLSSDGSRFIEVDDEEVVVCPFEDLVFRFVRCRNLVESIGIIGI